VDTKAPDRKVETTTHTEPEAPPQSAGRPVAGVTLQGSAPYGAAVQFKLRVHDDGGGDKAGTAADGVAGSGSSLPYAQEIQSSFGHHDVSGAQAHVGGEARTASERMGAEAYTTGSQVGFRESPDLRLAAHEAAHVVQQRGGVQLKGGVGAEGDTYERNADAVAERVVAGKSAEDLLDSTAGGGGGGAVQFRRYQVNGIPWDVDVGCLAEGGEGVIATPVDHSANITADDLEAAMGLPEGALAATSTPNQFRTSGEDAMCAVREQVGEAFESCRADFETAFNTEFRDILHAFPTATQDQSGQRHLGMDQIRALFTDEQIRKLTDYCSTHVIPDRLFNGVENRPVLTAQMRILMASQILRAGTQRPGATPGESTEDRGAVPRAGRRASTTAPAEQPASGQPAGGATAQPAGETTSPAAGSGATPASSVGSVPVEARCCRHWAMLVHAYAGITAPGDGEGGVQHTFDHQGHAVIGQGSLTVNRGGGVRFNNVRSGQSEVMPHSNPDLFEPGDWLEIAWNGHVGDPTPELPALARTHSVILSEVLTRGDPVYSIRYYSQAGNPTTNRRVPRGARVRGRRDLETREISRRSCQGYPVIYGRHRVSEDSGPARTEAAVLGSGGGDVSGPNRTYLGSDRMRTNLRLRRTDPAIDVDDLSRWLCGWLRNRNTELINGLGTRLSEMQRTQLTEANRSADGDAGGLERLVRLTQRLRILEHNRAHVADSDQDQTATLGRLGGGRDVWITHNDSIGQPSLQGTGSESRTTSGLVQDLPAGFVPWGDYTPSSPAGGGAQ
jgi:hypothetical protein